jgi:hypothetical protein
MRLTFSYTSHRNIVKHCWFVDTNQKEGTQFLAFVEVMEEHSARDYDPCIPVVKRCKSSFNKNPTHTVRSPTFGCNQYPSYHRKQPD